ncbi:MAG: nitroreductase family protein [Oscillospiraceae bacterium]|nr:nitroreductase family protein [Oscillospiraceae bacterium]
MNDVIRSLYLRKSCRSFTNEPVSPETKHTLFEAAFQAPTAGNQMLYTILDITDAAVKSELADLCDHQRFIATAPVVVVFLADCRRWLEMYRAADIEPTAPETGDLMLAVADAVIAAQNFVVAAESLELASCYIGDILENRERVRELLALPVEVFPAAMIVAGHPTAAACARKKPQRFSEESIVFENRYEPASVESARLSYCAREGIAPTDLQEFKRRMTAFYNRKYASDFMREMNRSAKGYLSEFAKSAPSD